MGGDGGLHAGGDRLSTSIFIVFGNVIYVGRGVAGCGPRPIIQIGFCNDVTFELQEDYNFFVLRPFTMIFGSFESLFQAL